MSRISGLARSVVLAHCKGGAARRCAELLDDSGSENEFRLKCAALNLDPDEMFRFYINFVWLAMNVTSLGLTSRPSLSDWWAFERIEGARKPDPWCRDRIDADSW